MTSSVVLIQSGFTSGIQNGCHIYGKTKTSLYCKIGNYVTIMLQFQLLAKFNLHIWQLNVTGRKYKTEIYRF